MNGYKTVIGETETVTVIERSKFICSLKGVDSEEDAKEYINFIRKKYPTANHNCYAYIADEKGLTQKFSDAGEPQGTAGMPMLNVLKLQGIYKTVAVVTRYFGGIKLGAGGLTRAYGGAVAGALEKADVRELYAAEFFTLCMPYARHKKFLSVFGGAIISTEYSDGVTVKIAVKAEDAGTVDAVSDALCGEIKITPSGKGYFAF